LTPARRFGYYLGHEPIAPGALSPEVRDMIWEAPDFTEVKMDAEINSYQDDFDREQDDRF
jgi:coenzyme PQQ precursor peptide PqqA